MSPYLFFIPDQESIDVIGCPGSTLNHTVDTEHDFGSLFCWARNSEGGMASPCVVRVIPARPPAPPRHCLVLNQTLELLVAECSPGWDGGLEQRFVLEVRPAQRTVHTFFWQVINKCLKRNILEGALFLKCPSDSFQTRYGAYMKKKKNENKKLRCICTFEGLIRQLHFMHYLRGW